MTEVTRSFCWDQNFVPWGCMTLPWGYIYVLNHEKNCIKSHFKEIFFKLAKNGWSDKAFLLTSKFCPLGAVCPCPWAIIFYENELNHEKNVQNQTWKRFFLNLQQMTKVTRCSCWHKYFVPKGLLAPVCIKSDLKEIFFKLVANDWSDKRFLLISKFCPLGSSAPARGRYTCIKNHEKSQGLCLNSFSSVTADFNISSTLMWAKQDQ